MGFGRDPTMGNSADLVMAERHEHSAQVTEHAVELGSAITDHIRDSNDTLSLEVWVTNAPTITDELNARGFETDLEIQFPTYRPPFEATPGALFRKAKELGSAAVDALLGNQTPIPKKIKALAFDTPFDRIREVQDQLTTWKSAGILFQVVTSTRTYEAMVIESVSLPREEPGGAQFTIALKKVRIVTTSTVTAPKPQEKRGAPAVAKGAQAPQNGQDAAKSTSLAMKALAALGL